MNSELYDKWTNSQEIARFIRVSYGQDKHTTFRESVKFFVESMRTERDRVSDTPVTDAEAAEAVEAIISTCLDYVEESGAELLAPIRDWLKK